MQIHDVVVAGAGPTGLMLAGELARSSADVVVVERRPDQTLMGTRAGGLSARSLELLDQRGIADRFLEAGQRAQVAGFAAVRLDISAFPTRHNYGLALRQKEIERLLSEWVAELGVTILRGRDVTGFAEDERGLTIDLSDRSQIRASFLVGCDGGRSAIRKTAGIGFPGWDATSSNILAQVEVTDEPPLGVHRFPGGMYAFGREDYEIRDGEVVFATDGTVGVMVTEADPLATKQLDLQDLQAALIRACGTDYGVHDLKWISRFTDATRQADAYRKGRVLIAGDAAHIHSPIGGQGLNLGLQDAVNLGWKLAQVVSGASPDSLLDTYHAERHPAGAEVLRTTMAQTALMRSDERSEALRGYMGDLLEVPTVRDRIAAEMSGLSVRYDFGSEHPLVGRRMPDLDIVAGGILRRVYETLWEPGPVLFIFDGGPVPLIELPAQLRVISAATSGPWKLPATGLIAAPDLVLVRPDGHVAWVGDRSGEGLLAALRAWCGLGSPAIGGDKGA